MVENSEQAPLLERFDRESGIYRDLAATIASLLQRIIAPSRVQLHSITHRCKDRHSLGQKLSRPEKSYRTLSDVTDLAAIRITTYFVDDVACVADLIENEFDIEYQSSTDKRRTLDPDRFGYQSLHYVGQLTDQRCQLVEYERFSGRTFEIQVRSILQHAWAEIEHDIGYKSAQGIPQNIRRRFARIAGLLELADDEFVAIREELATYAATVQTEIIENPDQVEINLPSLRALYSGNSIANTLDRIVADAAGGAIILPATDEIIERTVNELHFIDIRNIAEFENKAEINLKTIKDFAHIWLDGARHSEMSQTIGALYLAYIILGRTGDKQRIFDFLTDMGIGLSTARDITVNQILRCVKSAT